MPVPDYESLMLPALAALVGGSTTRIAVVRARVAASEGLTPEDVREMLPSGRQTTLENRVNWAVNYMRHAGLVERVGHGVYRSTQEGERLLARNPARIDLKVLREYPDFVKWRAGAQPPSADEEATPRSAGESNETPDEVLERAAEALRRAPADESNETPDEVLERAAEALRRALEADVLQRVRDAQPAFLERVVVDLLSAMGYGEGRVTGRSGDGGIDGVIQGDKLGLDEVCLQAKRYAEGKTVVRHDLSSFAGAIAAAGTTKGVFVTTARFTRAARDFVNTIPMRIVLIDGPELARLMVEHGIGVGKRDIYEIKRIDEDYFDREAL